MMRLVAVALLGAIPFAPTARAEVRYHVFVLPGLNPCCGSNVSAINDLGQVTGLSANAASQSEAYRWDVQEGIRALGDLPSGRFGSDGRSINILGHVAGASNSGGGLTGAEAYFWSPESGMIGLGDLPGGDVYSLAYGINDLDQVVGYSRSGTNSNTEAFLWDSVNGMVGLGDLFGGQVLSVGYSINNHSRVAGWSISSRGDEAFLWEPGRGMYTIPTNSLGISAVGAVGQSDSGYVVGHANNSEGFVWRPGMELVTIGLLSLPNPHGSAALDVNDAGTAVGYFTYGISTSYKAVVWDRDNGLRALDSLLAAGGPSIPSIRFAYGINNAGQIVAEAGRGVLLTPFVVGDMNCDGVVNDFDIDGFALALGSLDEHAAAYPGCDGRWPGDVNQDGRFDNFDIDPFIELLSSP